MSTHSLKFGTSGLRGLASELCAKPAYDYTLAFLKAMNDRRPLPANSKIYVGQDLRPSSPEIAQYCWAAIQDAGLTPIDCGLLPTPALSYYAGYHNAPCIMITGSHIPDDRNGLKFYRTDGEIDKNDEQAIARYYQLIAESDHAHQLNGAQKDNQAITAYRDRYLRIFKTDHFKNLSVGVYQHTSVARDLIIDILQSLGAKVTPLGRADKFVPVDTEALRPEDIQLLKQWANENRFDLIVSTDGDADRPLIADENGDFIRGDLLGAITACWLKSDKVVVPVTANSALDAQFNIKRTKVGSPYVIQGMEEAIREGGKSVLGFEANGGVLLGSDVTLGQAVLTALPTRDALLPMLACMNQIKDLQQTLSTIAAQFQFRHAYSDRLQNVTHDQSGAFIARLSTQDASLMKGLEPFGIIEKIDKTDGIRLIFNDGSTLHYRASGNAPELRCYAEASDAQHAQKILYQGLSLAEHETKGV
ncbi:phosphomannomutase [Paenochrobactrum pullorum]|uniref:phosphomannomutase n=1 Tax=Paenochrobactrum pullorum TaxID=1324351 RepID=UPI0035BC8571